MPKISRNCSKLEGFFIKKLISLIVRMRTNRGSTVSMIVRSTFKMLSFPFGKVNFFGGQNLLKPLLTLKKGPHLDYSNSWISPPRINATKNLLQSIYCQTLSFEYSKLLCDPFGFSQQTKVQLTGKIFYLVNFIE